MQNDKTGDKSGVGLKFLYSDLDLDLEELEQEMDVFFEWLLWFIDYDINIKHHQDYSDVEVTFNFNKTTIVNEGELIDMINNSRDMIPDKILLPKHPFVEDVTEVEEAIEEQEEEEQKKLEEQMKAFGNQPIVPQDPSKESQATAKNGGGKQSTAKNSSESQANVESKKNEKKDKKAKNNTNS